MRSRRPRRAMIDFLEALRPEMEAAGMRECSVEPMDAGRPDGKWRMLLVSRGMTATLHGRPFRIEIDLIEACGPPLRINSDIDRQGEELRLETLKALRDDDADTAYNLASSLLEHVLGVHARRADAAAALSLPAGGADMSDMAHVLMDEWTVARMKDVDAEDARHFARRTVSAMVRGETESEAYVRLGEDLPTLHGQGTLRWRGPTPLPMVVVPFETHPGSWFDGSALLVPQALPEAVVAAAAGRRLGEVVRTATELDERTIEDGDVDEGATILRLEPRPVPATWE